jgi:hypothetical protein
MTESQKLVGARGSKVLVGTGAHTGLTGYAIIVQEDTVIGTYEVDGSDAKAAYGLDTNPTLKAGAYIVVPSGDVITKITLTSGSVIVYNG